MERNVNVADFSEIYRYAQKFGISWNQACDLFYEVINGVTEVELEVELEYLGEHIWFPETKSSYEDASKITEEEVNSFEWSGSYDGSKNLAWGIIARFMIENGVESLLIKYSK